MSQQNHSTPFLQFTPSYTGIATFMHTPHTQNLADADMAIVGIPFDSGNTSWRVGTRFGPRSIRKNSLQIWGYNRHLQIAPTRDLKTVDYGDIICDPTRIDKTCEIIRSTVAQLLETDCKLLFLGGDHSISFPLIQAHAEKHGRLAVIHFDSHTDTDGSDIDGLDHGTPFRHAFAKGLIEPDAHIQVGIRGPLFDPNEYTEAQALGIKILTIEECFELGTTEIIRAIRDCVGDHPTYVTLDIDSIDPAYAPGTGTPEVGGFTSFQMLQLVRGLKGLNIIGCDLVEVNPLYDHGAITSILAANLAFELLSVMGKGKGLSGGS
ncbi:MAG: agmatinase [Chloroflexota bacterium]